MAPGGTAAPDAGGPAVPPLAELRLAAVLVVALGLAGVPLGWVWSLLAPRPQVVATGGGLDYADGETKAFIAGDGTLFLLGVVAGVVAAVVVWRYARRARAGSGPGTVGTVLGLVAGAALGAWVASRVGTLGGDRGALIAAARAGDLSGRADLPLQLHAHAVLLGWPGAAAAAYAVLALRSRRVAAGAGPDPADDRADEAPCDAAQDPAAPAGA